MDCVLFNGNVLTQTDPIQSIPTRAQAVAIDHGKIVAVGDDRTIRALATPHTSQIDLRGQTLVPGFEDAHAHVWKMGHLLTTMVDLRRCRSFDDLADLLKQRDQAMCPDSWLQARGFNEAQLTESKRPTREDLDRWVPDRPVFVTRTCGHIFVANSAALQLAGIDCATPVPGGGIIERDGAGEPNGILHETAVGLILRVLPAPTAAEYEAMIVAALHHQASRGITSSSDCGVLPALLDVYLDLDARGALPGRMVVMPLGRPDGTDGPLRLPHQHRSEFLCVHTVKFLADGGLSGATAALSMPYRNTSSAGVLRFADDDLRSLFGQAQAAGWRIATHAIGDRAIEQVLGLYEELGIQPAGREHRIEHLGLPSATQLKRAAALGIIAATQSIFLREVGRNFQQCVPDMLLTQLYPFRDMLASGMTMALSSDAPVVEEDAPLVGMHAAVTRKTSEGVALSPEQSISIAQALHSYTHAGAHAAGESHTRGTIEAGKVADFAVLDADPTAIPADMLLTVHVNMTMVGGKIVYTNQT